MIKLIRFVYAENKFLFSSYQIAVIPTVKGIEADKGFDAK